MLTCDHPVPPDRYDDRVEEYLRVTGFYHASQIDVALILGLLTDGLPVTGMTMSSFEALQAECLDQFGVAPCKEECRGCCIKLTWLRDLKENLQLTDEISIRRYVKCHIMLLIGTILFGDKSGATVHWKFLSLLRDFGSIGQYSWGSACLAYLYRALCRASRFNCKKIDGPLTLLLGWAWIRLPYLSPLPREPRSFSLANSIGIVTVMWVVIMSFIYDWQFVWAAYSVDRVDPNIIPPKIYMQSVVWSATVPLVSFECIEWHATDRIRRQFSFVQGVPNQERNLDKVHGEVLTGPKNLN
ncbi:serine/threonine-protein phosphatase 7 long form homolog [Arachis hypogaea]|uniref:serine/threonine-protein phosphatase 7 long form homolog n=1 Tax=Arachis hypogaea TaxID=3818 RepID=UPI003B2104C1